MQKEKVSVLNDKMQGIFETIKNVIIGALPDNYVQIMLKRNASSATAELLFHF